MEIEKIAVNSKDVQILVPILRIDYYLSSLL